MLHCFYCAENVKTAHKSRGVMKLILAYVRYIINLCLHVYSVLNINSVQIKRYDKPFSEHIINNVLYCSFSSRNPYNNHECRLFNGQKLSCMFQFLDSSRPSSLCQLRHLGQTLHHIFMAGHFISFLQETTHSNANPFLFYIRTIVLHEIYYNIELIS